MSETAMPAWSSTIRSRSRNAVAQRSGAAFRGLVFDHQVQVAKCCSRTLGDQAADDRLARTHEPDEREWLPDRLNAARVRRRRRARRAATTPLRQHEDLVAERARVGH